MSLGAHQLAWGFIHSYNQKNHNTTYIVKLCVKANILKDKCNLSFFIEKFEV
jgi:hypothetical protein